jgi:light-regulated signal transduction histidine kinase (bacteriophytochrome)
MMNHHILIVDDDEGFRKTLLDILRVKGYTPFAVASGQAALDIIRQEKPTVALLDLRLEDISGLTLLKEIKRESAAVECIVLTGYASQISAIEAVNLGAYGYMQKPYDVHQLLIMIQRAVEKQAAEQALKAYATELERSNRELQDFAHLASHDLQEPLRKIQAFSHRLKLKYADALDERGQDYLQRVEDAAARMQTLIQDLLTYSRVTTKAQPFRQVDLTLVLQDVLSDLEMRIEETRGRIEVGNLPTIKADQTQMRQLFQNLMSNALKFHHDKRACVIKVYAQDSPNQPGFCQIFIEDNGIGFDEKYLDRIFGMFQRLHSRKEYEGTGVGLAICRKIVEWHGGMITARSKPGQGATFIVTLPVRQN